MTDLPMNTDSIYLVWLIAIPFIGGLLSWFGELAGGIRYPRWIALLTMVLSLFISLWLWRFGDYSLTGIGAKPHWTLEFREPWIHPVQQLGPQSEVGEA